MSSHVDTSMDVILQRRLRAYELALDTARRDAVATAQTLTRLTARIADLELELSEARERPARLESQLSESRRARRSAEQRAYAERAEREELEQRLHDLEQGREEAVEQREELAAVTGRQRELEEEIVALRRRADEADHLVAASSAARERAEQQLAQGSGERTQRMTDVLRELRPQFSMLATLLQDERAARVAAQERVAQLEALLERPSRDAKIEPLRPAVAELAAGLAVRGEPSGPIDPDRLAFALKRLRAVTGAALDEASEAAPELPVPGLPGPELPVPELPVAELPAGRPWLAPAFRRMARDDPDAAGTLLLALLPLQERASAATVAYDIRSGGHYVQVTAGPDGLRTELAEGPRASGEVDFSVDGELAAVARLLAAGPRRRRLRVGLAKVRGDRRALAALDALLTVPVSLGALPDAGVELGAVTALRLVGAMIGPGPANEESFTLGFRRPELDADAPAEAALVIDRARPPRVTIDAEGATTTIICPPRDLLKVLAEIPGVSFECLGASDSLSWLQRRIKAAQSA
jgi:predicted  nucleic acid-binding Zn-ribbon protein